MTSTGVRQLALTLALPVAMLAAGGTRAIHGQQGAYRFAIANAGDSTFTFSTARDDWVKRGMEGIVVDPARHDVLIARYVITRVAGDSAVALITGQTTRLTPELVALLERPSRPWYLRATFWLGGVVGAIVGVVASR